MQNAEEPYEIGFLVKTTGIHSPLILPPERSSLVGRFEGGDRSKRQNVNKETIILSRIFLLHTIKESI
jgi:hypothetical protein